VSSQKLIAEFYLYTILTQTLNKSFLSIKGIYYQAVILGVPITWIQPYKFTQKLPFDVDYKIMLSFCEFYEALLKFVNFKLYKDAGLEYPPPALESLNLSTSVVFSLIQPFIHQTQGQLRGRQESTEEGLVVNRGLEQFKNFRFFLNRETPIYSLEFLLLSAGCQVGFSGEESPFDETAEGITHQVIDRPLVTESMSNREYIQPQWVYDCLNHQIILPTAQYGPGKTLPPHLSPFVDTKKEGYVTTREKEINQIKGVEEEPMEDGEEDVSSSEEEEEEKVPSKNVDEEFTDEENEEKNKQKSLKIKKQIAKENKELGKLLMTKKARKLYNKIQTGEKSKHERIKKLETKRRRLESKK
jgi:pescadillo protein